jgi:hypothetical protein
MSQDNSTDNQDPGTSFTPDRLGDVMENGDDNLSQQYASVDLDCEEGVSDNNLQFSSSLSPFDIAESTNSNKQLLPSNDILLWIFNYIKRFRGVEGKKKPPFATILHMIMASSLGLIGILLVSATDRWFLSTDYDVNGRGISILSGAYAATAGKYAHPFCCRGLNNDY